MKDKDDRTDMKLLKYCHYNGYCLLSARILPRHVITVWEYDRMKQIFMLRIRNGKTFWRFRLTRCERLGFARMAVSTFRRIFTPRENWQCRIIFQKLCWTPFCLTAKCWWMKNWIYWSSGNHPIIKQLWLLDKKPESCWINYVVFHFNQYLMSTDRLSRKIIIYMYNQSPFFLLDLSKNVLILSLSLLTILSFIPIHTFFLHIADFLYFLANR